MTGADFGPPSLALPLCLHCSAVVWISSLVEIMKINFAPMAIPLHRRLQTAMVLQWVFTFLGLGEC